MGIPTRHDEKHLLNLYARNADYRANNLTMAWQLPTELDFELLSRAVRLAFEAHAIMRLRYQWVPDDWWLVPGEIEGLQLVCGGPSRGTWPEWVADFARSQDRAVIFPSLRRVTVIHGTGGWALVITMNHSIVDCAGLHVLFYDVMHAYRALQGRLPTALQKESFTVADCATYEAQYLSSGPGRDNLAWWQEHLHGWRPQHGTNQVDSGTLTVSCSYGSAEAERLRTRAREARVTPSMLLLARYLEALAATTPSGDVVVRSALARRGIHPGDRSLVACLTDALLYRESPGEFAGTDSFAAKLMRQTAASSRRWLPYWFLVGQLCPEVYSTPIGLAAHEYNYMPRIPEPRELIAGVEPIPIVQSDIFNALQTRLMVVERKDTWDLVVTVPAPDRSCAVSLLGKLQEW